MTDFNPIITIITLNVNDLNISVKRQILRDKNAKPKMQSTRNPL